MSVRLQVVVLLFALLLASCASATTATVKAVGGDFATIALAGAGEIPPPDVVWEHPLQWVLPDGRSGVPHCVFWADSITTDQSSNMFYPTTDDTTSNRNFAAGGVYIVPIDEPVYVRFFQLIGDTVAQDTTLVIELDPSPTAALRFWDSNMRIYAVRVWAATAGVDTCLIAFWQ